MAGAERKAVILEELLEQGFLLDELTAQVKDRDLDPFDLICYVAFDRPPLSRSERARSVKQRAAFDRLSLTARKVIDALLDKYATEGVAGLEEAQDAGKVAQILQLPPFNGIGTPVEIVRAFGGRQPFLDAVRTLEQELYRAA